MDTENVEIVETNEDTDAEYVPEDDTADESETENETKLNRKTQKGSSKVELSTQFVIDSANSNVAKCKLCSQNMSFTTTADLRYHILKMHGNHQTVQDIDNAGDETTDGEKKQNPVNANVQTTKRNKYERRSRNWKFFTLVDMANKIAKCKTCHLNFRFTTVSNLKKHIKIKHPEIDMSVDPGSPEHSLMSSDISETKTTKSINTPQQHFRSRLWKHFDPVPGSEKMATCRLCLKDFNYACLSNLKKHLIRKHGNGMSFSGDESDYMEEVVIEQSEGVWSYFKCLSQDLKIASCLVCKKRVEFENDEELNKHLKKKHPELNTPAAATLKKLMITKSGDIYEIDEEVAKQEPIEVPDDNDSDGWPYDNDQDALDTSEYLDETIYATQSPKPAKKRRLNRQILSNSPKGEQRIPARQKSPENEVDSLDIFGKYIVALLKKLPKRKSDRLQADIVKQIMDAQTDTDTPIRDTNISFSADDARVSSNSEVRVITDDGKIQRLVLGNKQNEVTVVSEE